ncbi:phage tail sheath C-terminal domain-containing protein [Enterobacter hormaechei]|uniref:phage tail sheath C-terminal domain-containing protein n=1 Tax=Enterobacter hormaechei TaxID=158836 RepID=UPI0007355402|nr:phage tail sheath C-terminal domain-containing protein [Enterobacter hormaechei]HAS1749992.1 phage tail protein [Enterobacter hormaechei subsp. oharae]KTG93684.1 phage tail protein [Enterobacter hormaechei subsp. xiangfangensis]KTG98735.1 phage tail protein [Enterobacter hormaechei subsp. xiangfangensis]KTH98093.1 phage tail protein [Enterobacter hormaechei subsp. xiangfangensis]KTI87860.1 phage tail protein [Enterobacter hormaechei subsp. xiangfangensis]
MTTDFLHGVRTIEYDDGTEEISTVTVSVIGIVGTAPDSTAATCASLVTGSELTNNKITWQAEDAGIKGNSFSVEIVPGDVYPANTKWGGDVNYSTIYHYSIKPDGSLKLSVRMPVDSDGKKLMNAELITSIWDMVPPLDNYCRIKAIIYSTSNDNGKVMYMSETNLAGGADEAFPLNVPTVIAGSTTKAAKLGATGTLPADINDIFNQTRALIVVVRVADDADASKLQQNVIAGLNTLPSSGQLNEVMPRIIIAPDFSATDPVAVQIEVIANKVRGVGYIDSPSFATAKDVALRRQSYGKRVEILRPRVFTTSSAGSTSRAYSASAAGLRCRIDNKKGFWWSKSNQQIMGVTALEQVDEYIIGDDTCVVNLLNKNQVSTIVRRSGFKHWGNYLCSTDPPWAFECVRRTADVIEDSIADTVENEFIDRPIDLHLGDDIIESINGFIRYLFDIGAINGGKAWLDPELNTKESLAAGKLYINVEFAPKSPCQSVIITYRINNDYTVEQFAELLQAA